MAETSRRVLVACIGNIFLGDDAFGVEVAQELAKRDLSDGVQVVDFGIRGFDLAYALMDGYEATIMVDAIQRGGQPGTLYVIEPDMDNLDTSLSSAETPVVETHGMHPAKVLGLVKAMGGQPVCLRLVACEPATFGPEDEGQMGLSAPVQASVNKAAELVESIALELLQSYKARKLQG